MARDNLAQLCQERANQLECDCPPEKSWEASAGLDGNPCSGSSSGTSALQANYAVNYRNECGVSKQITVEGK